MENLPENEKTMTELKNSSNSDNKKCIDYLDELFRIGKTEFKKKYCIKN